MNKILARDLLRFTREQLSDMITGEFILVFDDGEMQVTARQTCYSAYSWIFHKEYPKTPLLKKHHIKSIIKEGMVNSRTHLELLGNAMWSAYDTNVTHDTHYELLDKLCRMVYQATNDIYNDFSYKSERNVESIDILDFIEIAAHPDVVEMQATLTPDKESVEREHNFITDKILMSKTALPHNSIVRMVQSGLTRTEQVLQCVGSRGRLTDIDSVFFRKPIMRGFVKGIRSFYDIIVESRSSAKAQSFSEAPLEDTEYFSRRLQLLCMIVQTVHLGDCGSKNYLTWHVKPKLVEDGRVSYQGDLVTLEGKYYLNEEGKLAGIKRTDTFLENKTIKIRSVVAGCEHPDPHGLCSVCFGEMYTSVTEHTNIGHQCATTMTEQTTQSVLSTKHSDVNSDSESISVPMEYKRYIDVAKDKLSYILPMTLKSSHIILKVQQQEALCLTDIEIVDDVNDLSMTRVSAISLLGITIKGKTANDPDDSISVDVNVNKRKASFTYAMLKYIKKKGYVIDEYDNISIDLSEWNFADSILTLPMKHMSMSDHSADVASMIESRVAELNVRDNDESPSAILVDFYDLVNSKLKVNLAVLEVIMYSSMCVNASQHNFDLPKPSTRKGAGVASYTIAGRSLSAAMDYKYHKETILNPASFFSNHRPSHICDVFIMPQETVTDI